MTAEKLWQAFTAGTYPKDDLIGLGKALFFGKPYGKLDTGPKKIASDVAARATLSPEALYGAMNKAPLGGMTSARRLLGGFGIDVRGQKPWASAQPSTRKLIETVASSLPPSGTTQQPSPVSATRAPGAPSSRPAFTPARDPAKRTTLAPRQEPEIDLASFPIFSLYRRAVQMGADDEPLVREAKRMDSALKAAGAELSSKTLELEAASERLRRENRRMCEMAIADATLAISQGKASRETVQKAKELAESCGMAKTAVELDRVLRGMPKKSGAGKALLGAVLVAAAAGGVYVYSQQKAK